MHAPPRKTRHIVILGAGFGGLYTALHLESLLKHDPSIEITLLDRDNYFTMTPLLFEASSGVLEPRHAVSPIRRLVRRTRFIEANVERIDFDRKLVCARHATHLPLYDIPYDHLVIGLGGVTNLSLIPGSELALTFKSLADAIFLRNHIIDLFERADAELDLQRRLELLTFVVVGGGLVGVELVGALWSFVRDLCRNYPRLRCPPRPFHLIEAGPEILKELEPDLAEYAARSLSSRGVHIITNTRVSRIEPGRLILPDGAAIRTATVIVATGVSPHPLIEAFPVAKSPKGRIQVDASMRSVSHPEVWALGDCAAIPSPAGEPYPPLAQHALREAHVLAHNIASVLHDQPRKIKPYRHKSLGTLAALGHFQGVGRIMGLRVKGFLAWWIWRTYYLLQMPHWSRRLRVVIDWTIALLFKHDIVKLDLYGEQHPTRRIVPKKHADGTGHPGESVADRSTIAPEHQAPASKPGTLNPEP